MSLYLVHLCSCSSLYNPKLWRTCYRSVS